jgi:hypothetical protein
VSFEVLIVVTLLSLPYSEMLYCVDQEPITYILEEPAASIFSDRQNELAVYTAPYSTRQ